ncbi:MFS transporter [Euzebya sp.]|uniref:MFS transporter n=1 Tax=Euzebya sp. TaxID=1971409 RepID=UPI00351768CE
MFNTPERRFRGLLGASAVSGVGDGVLLVALPLIAASLTRDPRLVTGVLVAQRLPWLLFSLHGGALVDRTSPRRLLSTVDAVRGAALLAVALVALTGDLPLALLYGLAFVVGTGDTIIASGLHAAIPAMVPDDELGRANGRIETTQVAGDMFVGPAIGGLLVAGATALPFLVDGVSFLVSATIFALVLPAVPAHAADGPRTSLTADVRLGLGWFRRHRALRLLAGVIGSFAFFQAAVLSLLVLLATDRLGLSEGQFGLFLALGAVGQILGATAAERIDGARVDLVVIVAGAVTASAYLTIGTTGSVAVAGGAYLVEGIALAIGNITTVSFRQRVIPRDLLGRVGAAYRMVLFAAMPLGAFLGGQVAGVVGVGQAIVLAGTAQLVVVGVMVVPLMRQLGSGGPDEVLADGAEVTRP